MAKRQAVFLGNQIKWVVDDGRTFLELVQQHAGPEWDVVGALTIDELLAGTRTHIENVEVLIAGGDGQLALHREQALPLVFV